MKYTKPVSKTLDVTPRDTICSGMRFNCSTWKCDGIWRCNSTYWKGCSKKYTV